MIGKSFEAVPKNSVGAEVTSGGRPFQSISMYSIGSLTCISTQHKTYVLLKVITELESELELVQVSRQSGYR